MAKTLYYLDSLPGGDDDAVLLLISRSLSRVVGLAPDASLAALCGNLGVDYLAAVFAGNSDGPLEIEEWESLMRAALLEVLEAQSRDDDADDASAEAVDQLRKDGVLDGPYFASGSALLAVLDEDQEWHPARVTTPRVAPRCTGLLFTEYDKPQETPCDSIRDLAECDDTSEGDAPCALCQRRILLTFHHLIPREVHDRYLGRDPALFGFATSSKFLSSYGVDVCAACHRAIHRIASNAMLAKHFYTLDKIKDTPEIRKWVAFAAKQRRNCA